jgi:hypothetical protein
MSRTKTGMASQSRMHWMMSLLLSANVMLIPSRCEGFRQSASKVTRFPSRNVHSSEGDSSSSRTKTKALFLYQEEGSRGFGEYPSQRRDEFLPMEPSVQNRGIDYYGRRDRYSGIDDDELRSLRHVGTGPPAVERINSVLRASRVSFRNVEDMTYGLFNDRPLVALAIFVGAGGLVAYMLGFFFLGGYIENWNPVENDIVPYWDEPEIHTIMRVVGK